MTNQLSICQSVGQAASGRSRILHPGREALLPQCNEGSSAVTARERRKSSPNARSSRIASLVPALPARVRSLLSSLLLILFRLIQSLSPPPQVQCHSRSVELNGTKKYPRGSPGPLARPSPLLWWDGRYSSRDPSPLGVHCLPRNQS